MSADSVCEPRTVSGSAARSRRRQVIMIGPPPEAQGGVAAVIGTLLEGWPADAPPVRPIATTAAGGRLAKGLAALRAVLRLLGALCSGSVALVHVHFAAGASFHRKALFVLLTKLFKIPVVGQAHSGLFPGFYDGASPLLRGYIRLVLGRLDRLLVLSEAWARFYGRLVEPRRIAVLPNPTVVPATHRERVENGPPVLLALGRLGRNKGTWEILAAAPAILARYPEAEIRLGGDGAVEEARALLAAEPWGVQVRLLGWVAGADKEEELRRATLFLLPSYAEGLPMAILEAMGHGVPVIATPVGAIPETVVDGETGLLIPPGDVAALTEAVLTLLDDPARRTAFAAAGRRLVLERFERSRVQHRLATLYREVLEGL